MTASQLAFYRKLESNLENGLYVPVEGQISYLFVYAYKVLAGWPETGFKEIRRRLDDLGAMYQKEDTFPDYCIHWSRECLIGSNEFDEFLALSEPSEPFNCEEWLQSQKRLNIHYYLGCDGQAVDLFKMTGGRVTDFTREHPRLFRDLLETCFAEEAEASGPWLSRILKNQGKDLRTYGHNLFQGAPIRQPPFPVSFYCFYIPEESQSLIRNCAREAENQLRETMDVPRVGEGWLSETTLFHALREAFPETQVLQHGQPKWLARQHFDIWFPDWAIAVEYHGEQHFHPVDFFGGKKSFEETQRRDRLKADLASRHGTRLLVVTREMSHEAVVRLVNRARTSKLQEPGLPDSLEA